MPRIVVAVGLCAAIAALLFASYVNLWQYNRTPGTFFGGDLDAYISGAQRLVDTGTPYHPALHAGPIANERENVSIAYLYPPPLAQVFTLVLHVDQHSIAVAWIALQVSIFAVLLPSLIRAGGQVDPLAVLGVWAMALAFFPLHIALWGGNVSGWIAIGVGALLLTATRIGPLVVPLLGLLKITPLVLGAALLGEPARIKWAIVIGLALVAGFASTAPAAWIDFFAVLPNILRLPAASTTSNMSSAAFLGDAGYPAIGALLALGMGLLFGMGALILGYRGRTEAAIASSVAALLLFPATLFAHYLVPMYVVALYAWPRARGWAHAGIAAFFIVGFVLWFGGVTEVLRPIYWFTFVIASVALVRTLAAPPEEAFSSFGHMVARRQPTQAVEGG